MRTWIVLRLLICTLAVSTVLQAGSRSSANYSIPTETMDGAGALLSSANYSVNGSSLGNIAALTSVASPAMTSKSGYVGQLFDLVGLEIAAPPSTSLNETASRQLLATPLADDATTLAALDPSTVTWSTVNGPIASISSGGLVTAGNVFENTPASVQGTQFTLAGQLALTIVNVGLDDFAEYAGDGLDDDWQVLFFGQPPNLNAGPNEDPDGDGQNNRFEFTAGLIPNDPTSRFALTIQNLIGQPVRRNVIFDPLVGGRTYTVQFTSTLIDPTTWTTLTGTTQSDNGNQRTVTDLNAGSAPKSYRVQITRP